MSDSSFHGFLKNITGDFSPSSSLQVRQNKGRLVFLYRSQHLVSCFILIFLTGSRQIFAAIFLQLLGLQKNAHRVQLPFFLWVNF